MKLLTGLTLSPLPLEWYVLLFFHAWKNNESTMCGREFTTAWVQIREYRDI